MRIDIQPDFLAERLALRLGMVPTPLLHTLVGLTLARAIMVATKIGVFDAVASGCTTLDAIASACGTHAAATRKLVDALVSSSLLSHSRGRYSLTRTSRRWLVSESPTSLRDTTLSFLMECERLDHLEQFLRSGRAVDFHRSLAYPEGWRLYQRGMRALAVLSVGEVARRTPIPATARDMLDIGGSHGLISAALCRRHPALRSEILDLPEAIEHAAPLLEEEGLGSRVRHRAGDARTTDLGAEKYDVVLMSQLAHYFSESDNRQLAARVARALRPGGIFVVQEIIRREQPGDGGQIGGLLDLWFGLTSASGTWSFEDIASWQRQAGLAPRRPVRLRTLPAGGQQAAVKPLPGASAT